MGDEIYIPVIPVNPTTTDNCVRNSCNKVQVDLDYTKGRGVILSAYPCEVKNSGIVTILITNGEYVKVEPMARLNRKRLDVLRSSMRNELSMKTGMAWDLVLKVCEKQGLTVV